MCVFILFQELSKHFLGAVPRWIHEINRLILETYHLMSQVDIQISGLLLVAPDLNSASY